MTSAGDVPSLAKARRIPVRSLGPQHRPRIAHHLRELDAQDRYWRFGYNASDVHIRRYVQALQFERDGLFGIVNRQLDIVAIAHLAYPTQAFDAPPAAEFAVSVRSSSRGRGYGMGLFQHAIVHARKRGIGWLTIHALSENAAMLHLALKAGACVHTHGSEAEARLALPPEGRSRQLNESVPTHAAELNDQANTPTLRRDQWLDLSSRSARRNNALSRWPE